MRVFEDIGSKDHFSAKKGGCWVKTPLGWSHFFLGQNNIKNEFSTIKLLRVQISRKICQFFKNHYHGGIFNIFWGKKAPPPPGGNQTFLAHSTDSKSLRTIISNICEKIIKIWCAVSKIQAQKAKRGVLGSTPQWANKNYFQ